MVQDRSNSRSYFGYSISNISKYTLFSFQVSVTISNSMLRVLDTWNSCRYHVVPRAFFACRHLWRFIEIVLFCEIHALHKSDFLTSKLSRPSRGQNDWLSTYLRADLYLRDFPAESSSHLRCCFHIIWQYISFFGYLFFYLRCVPNAISICVCHSSYLRTSFHHNVFWQ